MSRRGALGALAGLLVVLLVGLGLIVQRAASTAVYDTVRPGIPTSGLIAGIAPGREVCEAPIDLDRRVVNVGLGVDTERKPGPPLDISVRRRSDKRVLATASVPKGYMIGLPAYLGAKLSRPVAGNQTVEVCARNRGRRSLAISGKDAIEDATSYVDGKPLPADWAVFFPTSAGDRPSALSQVPYVLKRASVMRPGMVTPTLYVVLALLLLVVAPVLLWRALVVSARDGS